MYAGMSLEASNRRKSPVTLAVTAGYFFSLKNINIEAPLFNIRYSMVLLERELKIQSLRDRASEVR
jgi:hypothetical protein